MQWCTSRDHSNTRESFYRPKIRMIRHGSSPSSLLPSFTLPFVINFPPSRKRSVLPIARHPPTQSTNPGKTTRLPAWNTEGRFNNREIRRSITHRVTVWINRELIGELNAMVVVDQAIRLEFDRVSTMEARRRDLGAHACVENLRSNPEFRFAEMWWYSSRFWLEIWNGRLDASWWTVQRKHDPRFTGNLICLASFRVCICTCIYFKEVWLTNRHWNE